MLLVAAAERVDDRTVHEEEVGAARGNLLHAHDIPHDPVVDGGKSGVRVIARLFAPRRPDHLRTIAPLLEQGTKRLGRILQIGGHHDGRIAAHVLQTAGDRHVRSAVARQPDATDVSIHERQTLDHREGVIARVVVDDEPLPLLSELRHRLREPRVQRLEVGGFVERRREDREHQDPIAPSAPLRAGDTACFRAATTRC